MRFESASGVRVRLGAAGRSTAAARSGAARPPVPLQRAYGNRAVRRLVAEVPHGQSSGARAVVQRSVGFEFELQGSSITKLRPSPPQSRFGRWWAGDRLNAAATARTEPDHRASVMPLAKGEVWAADSRGLGLEFQADTVAAGSDIEIVTTVPFPETTAGRRDLDDAVTIAAGFFPRYVAVALALPDMRPGVKRRMMGRDLVGRVPNVDIRNRDTFPSATPVAKPQATIGVRLDRLSTMLADVYPGPEKRRESARRDPARTALTGATSQSFGNWQRGGKQPRAFYQQVDVMLEGARLARSAIAAFRRQRKHRRAPEPTPELVSLLTLVYAYLGMGASGLMTGYAKTIGMVMARTDFGKLFSLLDDRTRNWYGADHGKHWLALVEAAPVYTGAEMNRPVISRETTLDLEPNAWFRDLDRRTWVMDMARGIDRLTAASYPSARGRQQIEALGALGQRVDTTAAGPAGIFELRTLKPMNHGEWRAFALNLFDYVVALNSGRPYQWVGAPVAGLPVGAAPVAGAAAGGAPVGGAPAAGAAVAAAPVAGPLLPGPGA